MNSCHHLLSLSYRATLGTCGGVHTGAALSLHPALPLSVCRIGTVGGGMCGGLYNGDPSFSADGEFANNAITGTFVEGGTIDITVRLCDALIEVSWTLQVHKAFNVPQSAAIP